MIKRRPLNKPDLEPEFPERKPVHDPGAPKIKYNPVQWIGKQYRKIKKKGLKTTLIALLVAIASTTFLGIDLSPLVEPIMEHLNTSNTETMEILGSLDFSSPESIIFSILLILSVAGGFAANYFQKAKLGNVAKELGELTKVLKAGRAVDSPDGKKLTKAEMELVIKESLGLAESIIELTGVEVDLDGDGK